MERPAATLALTITLAIYLAACHSTPPGERVAVAAPAAVAPAQAAPAHAAAAPTTAVTLPTAAAGEPAAADPAVQAQAGDKLDRDLRRLGYKPETRGGEIYYCRTETELGSRFDHRVCAPAKELERRMNDSKDFTNRIQSGGIGPVK